MRWIDLGTASEPEASETMVRSSRLEEIDRVNAGFDRAKLDGDDGWRIAARHMIEDGQDPDEELPEDMELVVPPQVVREKLGMTQ